VDGTGSRSCPMACFHISGVETSGSAIRESVNLYLTYIDVSAM
jgi:hypothetical protein